MFIDDCGQGSMAMHTINQAQHNDDHDIDHALIYSEDDAPEKPEDAREFVASAIKEAGGNFTDDPEPRTNAVTVWYADGYHVDFAIYKVVEDIWGTKTYYHAGETWTKRDPRVITEWFRRENDNLSPMSGWFGVTVEKGQLRRITREFKFWAKSRASWSLPSGLVLTVLVVEGFQKHSTRDDLSFLNTLKAIRTRLQSNKEVLNPTDKTISLLASEDDHLQVTNLLERLDERLTKLESELASPSCTETKALKAWGVFFNSDWWSSDLKSVAAQNKDAADSILPVDIVFFRKPNSSRIKYDPKGRTIIPKGMKIRFKAKPNVNGPYTLKWEVRNAGDEARWKRALEPRDGHVDDADQTVCNESSAFRGDHVMVCELEHDGGKVRREIPVRIR